MPSVDKPSSKWLRQGRKCVAHGTGKSRALVASVVWDQDLVFVLPGLSITSSVLAHCWSQVTLVPCGLYIQPLISVPLLLASLSLLYRKAPRAFFFSFQNSPVLCSDWAQLPSLVQGGESTDEFRSEHILYLYQRQLVKRTLRDGVKQHVGEQELAGQKQQMLVLIGDFEQVVICNVTVSFGVLIKWCNR